LRISTTRFFLAHALLVNLCGIASAAESYPNRPLRFVVGNPAGGGQDILARAIGAKLSNTFSVPVVVDNRPGATAGPAHPSARPNGR
jgi:tripartite-type tricarboxylate transporter receptor subunit TctC